MTRAADAEAARERVTAAAGAVLARFEELDGDQDSPDLRAAAEELRAATDAGSAAPRRRGRKSQ
jgi:hypothetical protein